MFVLSAAVQDSLAVSARQSLVVRSQRPVLQSPSIAQPSSTRQRVAQSAPPQSTSVSRPSFALFWQEVQTAAAPGQGSTYSA